MQETVDDAFTRASVAEPFTSFPFTLACACQSSGNPAPQLAWRRLLGTEGHPTTDIADNYLLTQYAVIYDLHKWRLKVNDIIR